MVTIDFSTESKSEILLRAHTLLSNDRMPEWERDIWTFIEAFLNETNTSFSIFTSGSTGKPKLIKHTRKQLEVSATATIALFELKVGQHILLALPVKHIGGRMMIVRAIIGRLKLSYIPLSAKPLNAITVNDKFDFASFTPMQYISVLNDVATAKKVENIKKVILGGGEVSNVLNEKLASLAVNIYHTYGMTETASHVAVKKLNGLDATPYFTALENISFTVDERSCLIIDAPLFSKEAFVTNDVVELLAPNKFIWRGRADNVINSGGVKVQAEEVERKFAGVIPYRYFISGEKDGVLGEMVIMAIECDKLEQRHLKAIKSIIDKNLNKYERPKRLILIHKFRETETGKVSRSQSLQLKYADLSV